MTPTDPELVTRLRDWAAGDIGWPVGAIALLTEAADALDSARQREEALQRDEAELRQHFDAFGEGQEASLQGQSRASNPYPPGDSYGVGTNWCMWDDGYDCNINRQLQAQLTAAEARVQQLEAALMGLAQRWRAESEAIENEDDDASLKRFGTQMDPDGYILATVTLDTCAEELEKTVAVGRADTPEPTR